MVQPHMVKQQLMISSSSQLSLVNLLVFIPKHRRIQWWKMDQQTLAKMGINNLDNNIYFFTPTKQSYSKQLERLEVWKQMGYSHC